MYREAPPEVGGMIDALVDDGFLVVEIAWEEPRIWGGPRARTLACRYATVARWVYEHLHQGGEGTLFAMQGTSGGASQIAFALAHYGLDEIVDLASLGGGPPACPRCSLTPGQSREPLIGGNPRLHYPTTVVRFFLGDDEPTPRIVESANAYYDAITSAKTMRVLPDTAHNIEFTQAGRDAFITAVREAAESLK